MASTYVSCPDCGWEGKIGDDMVGRRVKCPKCKTSFQAELGGSYDLAGEEPQKQPEPPPTPTVPAAKAPRRGASRPKPKPEPADEPKSWLEPWPEE